MYFLIFEFLLGKNGQIIFNVLLTNYEMVVKDRQHFR